MKYYNKYTKLYFGYILALILLVLGTAVLKEKNIAFQKEILIKQAQTHFQDQINNRNWNAQYKGVYVKALHGEKPNPFLKENSITTEDGEQLLRITPSSMIGELSRISTTKGLKFHIVSTKPINPANQADSFETEALKIITSSQKNEYYELVTNHRFRYVGALVTTKECLACHKEPEYSIGSVVGGISIELDATPYENVVAYIEDKVLKLRILIAALLLSIVLLVRNQFLNNAELQKEVRKRTEEILSTKQLLQEILDNDSSLIMVFNDQELILANKTVLDFFNFDSLEKFKVKHKQILKLFENVYEQKKESNSTQHWIEYLKDHYSSQESYILITKEGEPRHFKPHVQEIKIKNQKLYIITLDEITQTLKKITNLEEKASKDALTNLFNRGKFDDVLRKEVALSLTSGAPLSLIFLDIDHFKRINDTYGHDVGDTVLISLAKLLKETTRKGDFIARWGGEEFVVVLHSTDVQQAETLANKLRKEVAEHQFEIPTKLTISLGVTQYKEGEDVSSFVKRADEALYEAKASGRNRVIVK